LLFPSPLRSSSFGFIPSQNQGPGPEPHNVGSHLAGNFHGLAGPLARAGTGAQHAWKASSGPLLSPLPCALRPCSTRPHVQHDCIVTLEHRTISPSPLLRGVSELKLKVQASQRHNQISFQRQRHGSGDQQRWHRAANASISDSRGAANSKGSRAVQSAGPYLLSINNDAQNRSKQLISSLFAPRAPQR
jgi:hypothetical protein